MEESIRKLEATRGRRIREEIPLISTVEREGIVHKYHPDYAEIGRRKLSLGPNKGEMVPEELADQLEGNSRIDPDKIELGKIDYDTDILVIGSGGAGLSAALIAQENGAKVLIATKLRLGDSNTIGAEGGTQAADRPNDSPVLHYLDMGFIMMPDAIPAAKPPEPPGPGPEPPGPQPPGPEPPPPGPIEKQKRVSITFTADRDQLFGAWQAVANLADMAGKVSVSINAESEEGFDKNKLRNAVIEPLQEADLIE